MCRDGGKWHECEVGGETHWLRDNKIWAERERTRQKQMDRYQWGKMEFPIPVSEEGCVPEFSD